MDERCDIAIVGAGAAGLMAGIWAGRSAGAGRARVVALDSARKLGAKILVAGGGRCNVTHHAVDESAYAGSSRPAIRNVLKRFDVPETVAFFGELGVELKREETGKLFPTTDDAHTVLEALLGAAGAAGVELVHPRRVESIERAEDGFVVRGVSGAGEAATAVDLRARRVVLATGGMSLPKSGSDGHGLAMARSLGHTTTSRVFPSLVPLVLEKGHVLTSLSGLTFPGTLEVRHASGKRGVSFTNSTLLTHFGLSGPSVLDVSRYYLDEVAVARAEGRGEPGLVINFVPKLDAAGFDASLVEESRRRPGVSAWRVLADHLLPERLARVVCELAGLDPATPLHALSREKRGGLARAATEFRLPIVGDRGFTYAEVTAGGVPLSEVQLKTMESRVCPGLYLCGEILDVDGRIGGFNFQWAWASGYVAGVASGVGMGLGVTGV